MKTSLIQKFQTGGIAFLMLAGSLRAAPIFFDDFNSYPEGTYTGTMGPWTISSGTSGRTMTVLKDTGNLFGSGTENRFLEFENTGDSTMSLSLVDGLPAGNEVITLSFNWIYPELTDNTRPFSIRAGTGTAAGDNIANIISFTRITSEGERKGKVSVSGADDAIFSLDMAYRFDIVFNASASTISYEDGTLGSKSYDVWINGVKVASGLKSFDRLTGDITSVVFRTDSNSSNLAYLDWVAVYSGAQILAPIPEPSTLALLGGAALGVILFRRKKCA